MTLLYVGGMRRTHALDDLLHAVPSYFDVRSAPFAADRECLLCPTTLSRFNPGAVCGPCERANRELPVPLVFEGHEVFAARIDDGDESRVLVVPKGER